MTFADLPAGVALFVDANVFVYHFDQDPVFGAACTDLLDRIGRQEVTGFTSTHVLSEVCHRLMVFEACAAFGWPRAGATRQLMNDPNAARILTAFRSQLGSVVSGPVQVLTIRPDLLDAAAAVSQQTGLLHNDSLLVTVMQAHGLTHLASHDADFDRVPGITRYVPA